MNPALISTPAYAPLRRQPQYHEIHVRTLKVNTVLPFALYTQIEGEYLVYRQENIEFGPAQRDALLENNIKTLFIASEHLDRFWEYLRGAILDLVGVADISLAERATLFYQTSTELTRNALHRPLTSTSVGTANTVVKCSLKMLGDDKSALHALMVEMETQPGLFQSSLNCCQYALALARQLGVHSQSELESFGMGTIFMDVGMLQLPTQLYSKEGPLSFDEWGMIKRHPALGLEMIADLKGISDLAKAVVIGHHERIDGSGFPQGLQGSELSLGLRIAQIVEHFNHLTAHPNRRNRTSSVKALQTMKVDLAECFDQEVLDEFIRLLGVAA